MLSKKAIVNRTAGVKVGEVKLKYSALSEEVTWRSKLESGSKNGSLVGCVCVSCVGGALLGSRSRTRISDAR